MASLMRTFRRKKKVKGHDEVDAPQVGTAEAIFQRFIRSDNFNETRNLFRELCIALGIDPRDHRKVFEEVKNRIQTHEAKTLWKLLGKKASQSVYGKQTICKNAKVLIIGAGPCGLRMAIEAALLGAKVVVLEKRDYIARNNVLHLWPFVIHDLKSLGARVFSPKFCSGTVDHVSIRRTQQTLLKVGLLLGVEVHAPVSYEHLVEPGTDDMGKMRGWRVKVSPDTNVVNDYEFDMVVGADGKSNTLKEFKRKCFRGKLAIAITANFVNRRTKDEEAVAEIPGLFYVFNPQFFLKLKREASIDLENFVYYRDDTHYFVMTARKQSLLKRGVLKQDYADVNTLLSRDNIDNSALLSYSREAANLATDGKMPHLDFALNHRGLEDVAIFDFTAMHQAEHSCMMYEKDGKPLLMSIVGDTLIEPFWPTGSGCARGFLSVYDAAWLLRSWFKHPDQKRLEILAERESIFKLLSQTKPDNLNTQLSNYTIDPKTRYGPHINLHTVKASQIEHLLVRSSGQRLPSVSDVPQPRRYISRRKSGKSREQKLDTNSLLAWYQEKIKLYNNIVNIRDLTTSWRDGLALCCLIHLYRPEFINIEELRAERAIENNKLAFAVIQQEFGISPSQTATEVASGCGDSLASLSYLTRLQDQLKNETPVIVDAPKPEGTLKTKERRRDVIRRKVSSVGMLLRLSTRRKRMAKSDVSDMGKERRESWKKLKMTTLDRCKGLGIAAKRITLFEQGTQQDKNIAAMPDTKAASSDCCICGKRLLVVERESAHGYFFHNRCFRCTICGCNLWLGCSSAHKGVNDKVQFYCDKHDPSAAANGYDELDAAAAAAESSTADSAGAGETAAAHIYENVPFIDSSIDESEGPEGATAAAIEDTSQKMDAYMADMMQMMGMMGINTKTWPPANTVCEEEISSSDIESGDDVIMEEIEDPSNKGKPKVKRKFYTLATSMRLMMGHEIQKELEEVQSENEELQEEGKEMENTLRRKTIVEGVDKDKLTDEWMDVLKSKQEVQDHKSKLFLRARLLDLQTKFSDLQNQLMGIQVQLDDNDDIEAVENGTEKIEEELTDVFVELRDIRSFLQETGETSV